jgi:hypothetical protein
MAASPPREILPGVVHWTTRHPRIGIEVSSYAAVGEGVVVDPLLPPEALAWLERQAPPTAVLLTNRHHYRDSGILAERWGCRVHCHRSGLHEFTAGEPVEPYDFGDILPGGVIACAVDAICPDETALYAPRHRALWIADALMREPFEGPLGFVPDELMGDDPEAVKQGLAAALGLLLDLDFQHLLLAHGRPILSGGRAELERFLASRAGAAE